MQRADAFFVELSDGRVVGMLGLLPETAEDAWLKRFYVRPDWKRRGDGRALLSAIILLDREKGFARLHTRFGEGYTEAACFYPAMGLWPAAESEGLCRMVLFL